MSEMITEVYMFILRGVLKRNNRKGGGDYIWHSETCFFILIPSAKEKSHVHSKDEPVLLSRENVKFKSVSGLLPSSLP